MILQNFFSVSRNAPAAQRGVISPSRQRQTLPVFFRNPDCGLSILEARDDKRLLRVQK